MNFEGEERSFLRFFRNCRSRFKKWDTDKIQNYQDLKAREVAKYAAEHSPFFNQHYSDYDLEDVWTLPTVTKATMMDNFSDYNTLGFDKKELIDFCLRIEHEKDHISRFEGVNVAMSSGTSGNKGLVLTHPAEEKYLQAALFARFPFPRTLKLKWGFILRTTTPAFNTKKFGQQLTYIDQLNTIQTINERLHELNPNILSGPPSMLSMLADEITSGRLQITPKRVVSYAEVLYDETRKKLEQVFGVPIMQIYQSSEGSMAMPCKHASLHINEDLMHIDLRDKNGDVTLPGEISHQMIVTDLHKRSQPIIRFELNDAITISPETCSCGSQFRVIDQIWGRNDDMYYGLSSKTKEPQFIFPDYIRRAIISSSDHITNYQSVQRSYTDVLIRVEITGGEKEHIIEKIREKIVSVFTKYGCQVPTVEVRFESPQRNEKSAKLIRIHRAFKHT
ncbi:MAG: F390 synthetase-related protein [Candidatus Kariarchaeaceae archaeon]|jgi:putative adenylate-forming enzyme